MGEVLVAQVEEVLKHLHGHRVVVVNSVFAQWRSSASGKAFKVVEYRASPESLAHESAPIKKLPGLFRTFGGEVQVGPMRRQVRSFACLLAADRNDLHGVWESVNAEPRLIRL
jgi:hypothetical protein